MHCFTHSALGEVYGFPTQPCPALIAIEPLFDVGWTVQGHSGSFMAEGRCEPYSHLFPVQPSISPPHQWPPTQLVMWESRCEVRWGQGVESEVKLHGEGAGSRKKQLRLLSSEGLSHLICC